MKSTWIVVAESSRARIFSTSGPRADLDEIQGMTQPEARLKERDLVSDSHGRGSDSGGTGRHAMGREVDQKHQEAMVFSRSIAEHLKRARDQGNYDKLILIAPPAFLGLLRKSMHHCCTERVVATVNKNLVQHNLDEIHEHLPEWF